MQFITHIIDTGCAVAILLLFGAGILHLAPFLGPKGKSLAHWFCQAPGLDWAITYFLAAPLIVAPFVFGFAGLIGAVAGQIVGLFLWTWAHELTHLDAVCGPRIVKVLNRLIGRWRNHAALWVTAIVTPLFWVVRMAEVFIYPVLAWLTGFPRYNGAEWVNVSRQKFTGLVGHDLIWCFYCDWMTGIWSLGSEMLRNVESFWCPIRFSDAKKCANCAIDFPDINNGWVDENAAIAQAAELVERMHAQTPRAWFGHPVRLTVKGNSIHPG